MNKLLLGVNIDHVATLRQARGTSYPDPVRAALLAEEAGADLITLHLREDRRHIQEADIRALRPLLKTRMNLEAALGEEMLAFAKEVRPQDICFVPEKREERTTEGGLDVVRHEQLLAQVCPTLAALGIRVTLFVEADARQLESAKRCGVAVVELHTGTYADAQGAEQKRELHKIQQGAKFAAQLGLEVHAGHGLNYDNVQPIVNVPQIVELNIGHAIVAESVFSGWGQAVGRTKSLLMRA